MFICQQCKFAQSTAQDQGKQGRHILLRQFRGPDRWARVRAPGRTQDQQNWGQILLIVGEAQ
jgi:hypothetical protein